MERFKSLDTSLTSIFEKQTVEREDECTAYVTHVDVMQCKV